MTTQNETSDVVQIPLDWQPMETSPKEGYPIQHVKLLMQDGSIIEDAHWAYGGGEEQPCFGPAWFRPYFRPNGTVSGYYAVTGKPQAWAPVKSEPTISIKIPS